MTEEATKKMYVYTIQIALCILISTQYLGVETVRHSAALIARYVIYILIIKGFEQVSNIAYDRLDFSTNHKVDLRKHMKKNMRSIILFAAACVVWLSSGLSFAGQEFLLLSMAYLVSQYPDMIRKGTPVMINYGVGMACSFFEGYLIHVIPSDGARFVGFEENIRVYESHQGVVFPVKRLFIIITKSLYCPPDLKHCNKANRTDLPYLEACKSLEDIQKDVAGVKNRMYRNSAYTIHRPHGEPLVYLSAEFATPLHTLHKVLEKRSIYDKLCDVDVEQIVREFCAQLAGTVARSPDTRGKCELVYYDDTNPEENLADVLLDKIREIEPNFEEVISRGHN